MGRNERKIGIIMAVIISACMGIVMALIVRAGADENALSTMPPAFIMILLSTVESVIVGLLVAFLIPLGKAGRALASKVGANPPGFKFTLINSIPFAFVNAIICSIVVCFINVVQAHSHIPVESAPPLMAMFIGQWLRTLLPSLAISYVISIVISPLVVKAVGAGKPESN